MIPSDYRKDTPQGEQKLFDKLMHDPHTSGWVVFHSLDVRKHHTKIESELDMVILVPNLGVLCLEVKGCDVSRSEGKWDYGYKVSLEGPFKQASSAMHALRKYMVEHGPNLSGLLFFSAVIFTRIDFDEASPEWHPWQFISKTKFIRQPISTSIEEILGRAHAHVKSLNKKYPWYSELASKPTMAQVGQMVKILRDNFEYVVSPRNDIELIEEKISHFTDEQFDALDLLDQNERIVFSGPAGTGKTFLAIEAARRAISEGKSVLFVCFNKLLSSWIKERVASIGVTQLQLYCGTFHGFMTTLIDDRSSESIADEYWQKTLPILSVDTLLEDTKPRRSFDFLIVDEAQDLITEEYLDVMDLVISGGLAGGNWVFFGDFEKQAIYISKSANDFQNAISLRSSNYVKFPLRINCRNAGQIAETIALTSGMVPGYRKILHAHEGAEVEPIFYKNDDDQKNTLYRILSELTGVFKQEEIVILSRLADEKSCSAQLLGLTPNIVLSPFRIQENKKSIKYTTIQAFKGLEAPVVIVSDITQLGTDEAQALLYVAMSRARIRLFMLMHENCRVEYQKILLDGLTKKAGEK